jgi:hypothetical protein
MQDQLCGRNQSADHIHDATSNLLKSKALQGFARIAAVASFATTAVS